MRQDQSIVHAGISFLFPRSRAIDSALSLSLVSDSFPSSGPLLSQRSLFCERSLPRCLLLHRVFPGVARDYFTPLTYIDLYFTPLTRALGSISADLSDKRMRAIVATGRQEEREEGRKEGRSRRSPRRVASHRDFRVAAMTGEARIGSGHRALYSAAPPSGWHADRGS